MPPLTAGRPTPCALPAPAQLSTTRERDNGNVNGGDRSEEILYDEDVGESSCAVASVEPAAQPAATRSDCTCKGVCVDEGTVAFGGGVWPGPVSGRTVEQVLAGGEGLRDMGGAAEAQSKELRRQARRLLSRLRGC